MAALIAQPAYGWGSFRTAMEVAAAQGVFICLLLPMQAFTVALDGTLRLWDIAEGFLARTFELGKPIQSLVRLQRQLC